MGLTVVALSPDHVPSLLAEVMGTDQFAFKAKDPSYDPLDRAWTIKLPAYVWTCGIVDNPAVSILPRPREPESWRVGFVQNVLYERFAAQYERGAKANQWPAPLLDATDQVVRPFSYRQAIVRLFLTLNGGRSITLEEFLPYRDVAYGPNGVGERLDPATGEVVKAGGPLPIHFGDAPSVKVAQLSELGNLQSVAQLSVFRFWVLAILRERVVPLAFSSAFTLVSSLELSGTPFGIMPPAWKYRWTVQGSDKRSVDPQRLARAAPNGAHLTRVVKGVRVPEPVLTGPTANEVMGAWARSVRLARP